MVLINVLSDRVKSFSLSLSTASTYYYGSQYTCPTCLFFINKIEISYVWQNFLLTYVRFSAGPKIRLKLYVSFNLSILLLIYSLCLLCTCKNVLRLAYLSLSPKHLTYCPSDVLIHDPIVTPKENLNMLTFATSSFVTCFFLSATISKSYNIAGLFSFIGADSFITHHTSHLTIIAET